MFTRELLGNIDREVELLSDLLTNRYELSETKGYQGDHLYVRGYIEDREQPTEHSYYHEMLEPAIKGLAALLNNANYMEFEKLPCIKPSEGAIQVIGGGLEYGFWLRKTTSYNAWGHLNPCPVHVAPDGYYGSDDLDNCPDSCTHDSTPHFDSGHETIYDVFVRSSPKLEIK